MRATRAKLLRNLDWRMALGALLLWALLAAAVAFVAGRSERERALQLLHSELQSLSQLRVESLARQIDRRRQQVRLLARTPPALGMVAASHQQGLDALGQSSYESWQSRLETIFSAFVSTTPDVLQVRLIGVADQGRELIRVVQRKGRVQVQAPNQLQSRGDAAYFREAVRLQDNEVHISAIELSREHGDERSPLVPTMRVATPLFDSAGELFGIVLVDLDAGRLLATMQTGSDEKQLRVYMTDQNGYFLLHPDPNKAFAFEPGRTWRWQDEFRELDSPAGSRKLQLLQNAATQAYAVTRRLRLNPGARDGRSLTIAMAVTEAPVVAAVASARQTALLAMLGGGLLAALLAFAFQRQRRTLYRRRAELAAIVGGAQDAIIGTDLAGVVSSWNPAAERMFGYAANEAVGRPLAELIVPPEQIEEDASIHRRAAGGEPVPGIESVRRRRDGSEFAVSLLVTPIIAQGNGVAGLADTIRDVSAQRLAERKVREMNAALERQVAERTQQIQRLASLQQAIVADASYAMVATDLDGLITLFNPAAEKLFGYAAEELLGRQTPLLWHDGEELAERAQAFARELQQPLGPGFEVLVAKSRRGVANRHQWSVLRKDGTRLAVLLDISALRDEHGVIQGYLAMASDISRQQQSQRELLATRDQLAKIVEVARLGIWTWVPADDSLIWNARMFELYQQPPSLNGQGLNYAHWRSRVHPEDIEATEAALRAAVEGRGEYDPVFRIVLPDGQIRHIQAGAYVERDDQGQALRVTGINLDISAQRQVESTLRGAKEQAEAAGQAQLGMFDFSTSEGQTITHDPQAFSLDCQRAEAPEGSGPAASKAPSAARATPGRPRGLSGLRLLLVEDNPTNQLVARELLISAGAEVAVASDGQVGIAAVQGADPQFDAVLMDIQMPGIDGYEATRELRRHYTREQLPIIAMTANAMPADRAAALDAGMNEHVGKPFELATLVAVIRQLSGRGADAAPAPAVAPPRAARRVLDDEAALRRFDGSRRIYQQALGKFSSDAQAQLAELPITLEPEREGLLRQLHSLKGLAATIGAETFAALAADACKLLAPGCSQERWTAMRAALMEAGQGAVSAAQALLETAAEPAELAAVPPPAAPLDDQDGRNELLALWRLLEANNMDALCVYDRLHKHYQGASVHAFKQLGEAIEQLDFTAAAAQCQALLESTEGA
ncbi:PAS domain S-box protein [Pseudomonas sp. LPB0260]|uniref:PAS domain S-box protein n=1 Tax=Pseudomonas sp. LPB0260 TaxID=2614442 RepID=UPI0015C2BF15|nr:PAS domain S-box protein [Pseudomonas sp. LPB0260]QLC74357.1 PAS domain S-box protein [Pseudomonas sp. LPB0260]QLC77127.1 PAS domain S-box protein [Pseudomonas sp. LPB0260]